MFLCPILILIQKNHHQFQTFGANHENSLQNRRTAMLRQHLKIKNPSVQNAIKFFLRVIPCIDIIDMSAILYRDSLAHTVFMLASGVILFITTYGKYILGKPLLSTSFTNMRKNFQATGYCTYIF